MPYSLYFQRVLASVSLLVPICTSSVCDPPRGPSMLPRCKDVETFLVVILVLILRLLMLLILVQTLRLLLL